MSAPQYAYAQEFLLVVIDVEDFNATTPSPGTMALTFDSSVDYDVPVVDSGADQVFPMGMARRLPPAAQDSPVWRALADAIDYVWATLLIEPAYRLRTIRNPCQWHPLALRDKVGIALLDEGDLYYNNRLWCDPSWPGLVASQLGVAFPGLRDLPIASQITFLRHVVGYLPFAGTPQWVNFLGYALGADIQCDLLWKNSVTGAIRPEGHSDIAGTLYEGGPWYPISRIDVRVRVTADYPLADDHFHALFALLAPYDYVVRTLTMEIQDG